MSTTTSTPTAGATTPAATTQVQNATQTLGKDDFLKLFVAQMQYQDPMNPMKDTDSMGQMAQFSALEQMTNVAKATEAVSAQLGMSQAISLLHKNVTYVDDAGTRHTGLVQKVVTEGGVAKLTIDGVDGIDPATVAEVEDPTTPTP